MNKAELTIFLFKARSKTYAGGEGRVEPAFRHSSQLEYTEGDWLYRDIYYTGKNTFVGLENIYYKDKPVFSMSYFGNWGEMTEEEIDVILRGALVANPETRAFKDVKWEKEGFVYECAADTDSIDEIGGTEVISKDGEQVYYFYYAGSLL